jgi:hypothetical protein
MTCIERKQIFETIETACTSELGFDEVTCYDLATSIMSPILFDPDAANVHNATEINAWLQRLLDEDTESGPAATSARQKRWLKFLAKYAKVTWRKLFTFGKALWREVKAYMGYAMMSDTFDAGNT